MADVYNGRILPEVPLLRQMNQDDIHNGSSDPADDEGPTIATHDLDRRRPWSSQGLKAALSPSPTFVEARRQSKDDNDVDPGPVTPKKAPFGAASGQGLSLQMPPRDISSTSTANLTTRRIPQSPKPDPPAAFTSPTSVLPRRSRGMDFSRAATNLHHSTLAEQPSPESSPTVGGRRGMPIPPRKGLFGNAAGAGNVEIPALGLGTSWTTFSQAEKSCLSSSVPNSMVMDDESTSSSSDEDEIMDLGDDDDTIHMTPQANGMSTTHAWPQVASSPITEGNGVFPAAAAKLLSYQRHRVQSRRSRARKGSSSASGQSALQSPGPNSPLGLRPMDNTNANPVLGFLLDEPKRKEIQSRRESLSLGTNDLQLSDAEQSDDGSPSLPQGQSGPLHPPMPKTPGMEERREVVRKAVTRRGNLLPKSKNFARIRAELLEEGAPVDSEFRREAEVIRQVRESDTEGPETVRPPQPSQSTTSASSPFITESSASMVESLPDIPSLESGASSRRNSASTFSSQANRNSRGISFWNNFDERTRTPPPIIVPRSNSSGASDEMNVETPQSSIFSVNQQTQIAQKPEELPAPNNQNAAPPRKGNKRMRDDDFDPNYFKRRAVSPGLSVQNSPVLPQSPGWWGAPSRHNQALSGERAPSNGSNGSAGGASGPKRVGLQGMNDTNDGLMNMSIE